MNAYWFQDGAQEFSTVRSPKACGSWTNGGPSCGSSGKLGSRRRFQFKPAEANKHLCRLLGQCGRDLESAELGMAAPGGACPVLWRQGSERFSTAGWTAASGRAGGALREHLSSPLSRRFSRSGRDGASGRALSLEVPGRSCLSAGPGADRTKKGKHLETAAILGSGRASARGERTLKRLGSPLGRGWGSGLPLKRDSVYR